MIKKIVFSIFVATFVLVCAFAYSEFGATEKLIDKKEITETTLHNISVKALQIESYAIPSYGEKYKRRAKLTNSINVCIEQSYNAGFLEAIFECVYSLDSKASNH